MEDLLKAGETLFSNPGALDTDFVPKLLPHRENQQKYIAECIKPLLHKMNGKNLIVKGTPGIGKTACVKRILMDLEEETDDVKPLYVNCWNKNTSYKILTELCHLLNYKFTHNMSADEVTRKLEKLFIKPLVFVFDEIDKVEDYDFLYFLLESPVKKVIILITSDLAWSTSLDQRVLSRLMPDSVTFNAYTAAETADILKERITYAFYQGVWSEEAFAKVVGHAANYKDIRVGIALIKSAGLVAEEEASRKVLERHAKLAIDRMDEIKIKSSLELTDEDKHILAICSENDGALLSDLFSIYQKSGGSKSERTFRRRLNNLANKNLIELKVVTQGVGGVSTKMFYKGFAKTLEDFS